MKDINAARILAQVMGWTEQEAIETNVPRLQLLAEYKYDHYQRYGPGKRFVESLALWINQFSKSDRDTALALVQDKLIFISDKEFSHLVQLSYPDIVVQERLRVVAEETGVPTYRVSKLAKELRFNQLRLKSLYLGLSDGAHTNELRRASNGAISNEQIWQAYELGEAKSGDMLEGLRASLLASSKARGEEKDLKDFAQERFNLIWLVDDFSGSGNTYIRFDPDEQRFKGKIKKIYDRIYEGDLIDPDYYEVYLLLYVATRQAIDHIEYWTERFTTERGYKPLKLHVLNPIEEEISLSQTSDSAIWDMIGNEAYYDKKASDRHILIGGTTDAVYGFAGCALPLVLSHNTPNNSVYILWGPEEFDFFGLFPRISRHRDS